MSEEKTPEEQIKELEAQVNLLKQQTSLLTNQTSLISAQITNQAAQQTTQATIDKAVAEKLKELVESESNLEKARAQAQFAELSGIKASLDQLKISGKEGTISIAKGTDGALIFRVKKEMLKALDDIAKDIVDALPADETEMIVASKNDLEAAYKSQVLLKRLDMQLHNLQQAVTAIPPDAGVEGLAAGLAAVQGVGLTLNALSDFGKFFRVDRSLSVFDAGEEAREILTLLIEKRAQSNSRKIAIRIDELGDEVLTQADTLIKKLEDLRTYYDQAAAYQARLQKALEAAAKLPANKPKPRLPSAEQMATLKGEIDAAKLLLDGLNPAKASDAFWSQVASQVKYERIANKNRLTLDVKAQTVQILEKRTWRSDRLLGSGEVQVFYRLTKPDGQFLASGVFFRASPTRDAYSAHDDAEELKLPFVLSEEANP